MCAVHAFWVHVLAVLPSLHGYRMCPECPDCAMSDKPCTDVFGSNATPMGGSAGRCDAVVGAVEAQKAEGVLHQHLFLFIQMAHQFCTLQDIAEKLRDALLTVDMLNMYVTNVRRAAYPKPGEVPRGAPGHRGGLASVRRGASVEQASCMCDAIRTQSRGVEQCVMVGGGCALEENI